MNQGIIPSLNLPQQAIKAALNGNFESAVKLNKDILKDEPLNIDALNRLAKAYLELGKLNMARKFYGKVLKIDSYNPIASKNIKIIKAISGNESQIIGTHTFQVSSTMFLQEPGKTKVINLLKVAEPQKLSQTYCGMPVQMLVKNRRVTIMDCGGGYLGVLPDDVCHNLIRFIKGGNKYDIFIKSVKVNSLAVLVKETFRSRRFKNQPSFLETSTFEPRDIIHSIPDLDEDSEDKEETEEESI